MTKEQIFRSDRFFTEIENGRISSIEISEDEAFERNWRDYFNSASYRESVDARILISEQEGRIKELETAIKQFINYYRLGHRDGIFQIPLWQVEELASVLITRLNDTTTPHHIPLNHAQPSNPELPPKVEG